ncbi:MAG: excinuclease ABC subunit UvrA [Anaerolineae bacterium]|nr:MAG: uvrABC system protein A [Chloroflexi bacterium OLB13]MBW7880860.1 excinuclease ABC subunit UvrA [Anaerolineae bacterium]MEB2367465.1 excinuclease ABC subunit UvrA [Chloroflexota bacterium]
MSDKIVVHGAREHNLKNIDVEIPRDQLVVISGLSGSGKSSLAFDTIFAEGQRRYVESLSAYARQFLGQMEKPDVDQIEGLSPAVSIDQKGVSHNPRSTVGTVTEIYDYLRLLYARIGVPHCPVCGEKVVAQSAQQIVDAVKSLPEGTRIQVLAPVIRDKKGNHEKVLDDIKKQGFVRVRVDGEVRELEDEIKMDRYKIHNIEIVVDRLVIRRFEDADSEDAQNAETRLTNAIETALKLGEGVVMVNTLGDKPDDILFSEHLACVNGHGSIPDIEPSTFSFNTPRGACPECQGLGFKLEFDPARIVANADASLAQGAIDANGWNMEEPGWTRTVLEAVCSAHGIDFMNTPWKSLTERQQNVILYGTGRDKIRVEYYNRFNQLRTYETKFEGVINNLRRRYNETSSEMIRETLQGYMTPFPCETCNGRRLRPEALAVTVAGKPIYDVTNLPIALLKGWVDSLRGNNGTVATLSHRDQQIAYQILKEIEERVRFLNDVGLSYLTLARSAASLSGGEAQRIRLATQIGSRLTGVLYVLDEPSIGLHQRDNGKLIRTLMDLRDLGNTVLVVEHDEETMRCADHLIDLGPGAGEHGGKIVAQGTPDDVMQVVGSPTGDFLSGRFHIPVPETRREGSGQSIRILGAAENNLKDIDVDIPLGKLVCVTGVSGSGKSTLIVDILHAKLAQAINGSRERPGRHTGIEGIEQIDKIINIDQSPIGRTPRSNPGTYTKMFDSIRDLFAELPESKMRGYGPGRFSFNVKGGRCENCQGQGQIKIEMQFLPDIYVDCEVCKGSRYNRETLQVHFKGKSIADVLDMTVTEGLAYFENIPTIRNKLETLDAVGLGYIRIGQPATQLSGGEAQRVKLSRELSKRATGSTLYILDEPSTGLHAIDVSHLITVLQTLVDNGNTVVVIEHNLDIIKVADHIIDLGPEGGDGGGEVIAEGTPEEVAQNEDSFTGQYLRHILAGEPILPIL